MSHTPPRCPNKQIAALIKAADFRIRLPAVTPWAGASGSVTTPEAFQWPWGNAQHQSEVSFSATSPGSTGSWSHLRCSSATTQQHCPAQGFPACLGHTKDLQQERSRRGCPAEPSPQHVCCQARGATTPHPPAAFARGSPGCAKPQVTATEGGDMLPVPTSTLGDNNSHLGYNDSGGRCVQFWPHTSVLGGLCCLPAWPIWVPSFSLEQSGQTHRHVNLLYSTDPLPASTPALPTQDAGWTWLLVQSSARSELSFIAQCWSYSGFPPSCRPGFHPSLPGLPQLLQLQLIGVPDSILAHETSWFPVRHSYFYLTPFQLPKLARSGSCIVCLGRRCVATNYF